MMNSWRMKKKDDNGQVNSSAGANAAAPPVATTHKSRLSRELFLPREIQELSEDMPQNCHFKIPNPNELHRMELIITPPSDSMWFGGIFKFNIEVPPDYKYVPPKVRCATRIYHPNINESGEICLSILRLSFDENGWLPTRSLKDVVCGLNSLFTDLLNFDDPLNTAAAEHYARDPRGFTRQVKDYIAKFSRV